MRILLEAHHPAHIHFWKYPVREMQARGHEVLMIGRDRDVMRRLLEVYDWIPHEIPPRSTRNNRFPLAEMLQRQWAVAKAIRRFKPDVVASLMGSYTQSAKLLGVRNIIFTDSEFQHFNHRIAHPFAEEIHTPECFYKDLGPKQIRYKGIHEMVFLNPKYFKIDKEVLSRYALPHDRPYLLIRLSAWNTLHDVRQKGIGGLLEEFIEKAKKDYEIILSAEERHTPPGMNSYAVHIAPEDFHQVLAQAAFVLTEGASTASEAACLGTPCVYINSTEERGYLRLLEHQYGLVRSFRDASRGIRAASLMIAELRNNFSVQSNSEALSRLGKDFEDLTKVVVEIVTENE